MAARVRHEFPAEDVEKMNCAAARMTIDDLHDSVKMGEDGGKKTAKVKMKNDRPLTTQTEVREKWLADPVWFKWSPRFLDAPVEAAQSELNTNACTADEAPAGPCALQGSVTGLVVRFVSA